MKLASLVRGQDAPDIDDALPSAGVLTAQRHDHGVGDRLAVLVEDPAVNRGARRQPDVHPIERLAGLQFDRRAGDERPALPVLCLDESALRRDERILTGIQIAELVTAVGVSGRHDGLAVGGRDQPHLRPAQHGSAIRGGDTSADDAGRIFARPRSIANLGRGRAGACVDGQHDARTPPARLPRNAVSLFSSHFSLEVADFSATSYTDAPRIAAPIMTRD